MLHNVTGAKISAAKTSGVHTFKKVDYSIRYNAGPSLGGIKAPVIVIISPNISEDKAIELLESVIAEFKKPKVRREGRQDIFRSLVSCVHI